MSSLKSRVLTFAVGVPGITAIILFFPFLNHIVFILLAVFFIGQGSRETVKLFNQKEIAVSPVIPYCAAFFPVIQWLIIRKLLPESAIEYLIAGTLILILSLEIFAQNKKSLEGALIRSGASFFSFIYPGFLAMYAVRMIGLPHPGLRLLVFLLLVFTNDTAAYIFGSLFGRRSRKLFIASPNKSIVGFISGFFFTIIIAVIIEFFLPHVFTCYTIALLAGIVIGITGILGDLAESVLKRSAVIKDSGDLFPGRGGILDSIDSIIFSAPFVYIIFSAIA